MHPRKIKVGDRFGRLVITDSYVRKQGSAWMHNAICDCGNGKTLAGSEMQRGRVRSCGCFRLEQKTTHGRTNTPEYPVWAAMIQRCTKSTYSEYHNYGGRGISICKEWMRFENFIADMGDRPSKKHTLERVDNDGNYEPSNCIWATRFQQSINQRIRADNKTGYRGVSLNKVSGKYYAKICVNKKQIHLGCFELINDAITAREKAEAKYFKL